MPRRTSPPAAPANPPAAPADVVRLPGRFRVRTASGEWWARMGTATEPGSLERIAAGQAVEVCPLPEILDRIVYRDDAGDVTGRAVTVRWHQGDPVRVDYSAMPQADAWIAQGDIPCDSRVILVLAAAVRQAARYVPEIDATPRWAGGRLNFPPDHGPRGYAVCRHDADAALESGRALAGLAAANPKVALVAGAALGGLYVEPLERESFILHLVGDSREGKTTALTVAAAVLGDPRKGAGVLRSWNTTAVGLNRRLAGLAVLPAVVDELGAGNLRADHLEALVFRVTEGADREVATRTGSGLVSSGGWRSVLVTSGNRGLANVTTNPGLPARAVDLATPITDTPQAAETIVGLAVQLAGWPLRWALADPDPGHMADLLAGADRQLEADRGGIAGTVARHLALCVAGAERLDEFCGTARLGPAALAAAREHLEQLAADLGERGRLADQLHDAVLEQRAARPYAYPPRDDRHDAPRDIEGYDDGDGRLYVLRGALHRIAAAAGIEDPIPALRDLRQRELLETEGRDLQKRIRLDGRIVAVYVFRSDRAGPARAPRGPARGPDYEQTPCSAVARGPRGPVSEHGRELRTESERLEAAGRRLLALPDDVAARVTALESLDAIEAALDALDRLPKPVPAPAPAHFDETKLAALEAADRARQAAEQAAALERTAQLAETYAQPALGARRAARAPTPAPGPQRRSTAARAASRELLAPLETRQAVFASACRLHHPGATDAQAAAGLARLEAAAGLTYEAETPAKAGLQWMHALARVPLEAVPAWPKPDRLATAFPYTDPAQADISVTFAAKQQILLQYDVNAMYANAAQAVELGTGPPARVARPTADTLRLPGFVAVPRPSPAWPAPFGGLEPGAVIYTGAAQLLAGWLPKPPRYGAALVWPQHRRWLSAWARRLLDARRQLAGDDSTAAVLALDVLKRVYTGGIGMLGSGPGRGNHNPTEWLRPDWHALIRAHAVTQMWRALHDLEPGPAAVVTDSAFFLEPPAGLVVSAQPGKWKLERTARLSEGLRQAIRDGQPGTVRNLAHQEEIS